MTSIPRCLVLALPLLSAMPLLAQHETLTVIPDTSSVRFTLAGSDHATQGTFHVESGAVTFDHHGGIAGIVLVSATSGSTGNGMRDKKMANEVLQATNFATITFAPKSYEGTLNASGDSTIQVSGVFTLHGAPHDITVPMQVHLDPTNCFTKTHFTIPYVKWGLKDPSILFFKVAKEVDVDLTLNGKLTPAS